MRIYKTQSVFTQTLEGKSDEYPPHPTIVTTTRVARLFTVGSLLSILVLAMLIQARPLPQITVDEMISNHEDYIGKDVHVRGSVKEGSVDEYGVIFVLTGNEHEVIIDASGIAVPEGLTEGTTVAVQGKLRIGDNGWEIDATVVQTGCPSKYEAVE